ncbi:MAG: hypothetical protein HFH68_00715 [Lachnospiraceae bacterium]|nr:hypothetical protein [Lachnospiraceae bacterium]
MQILYGNDQINYCVIAKSSNVTENILNELKNRELFFYNFSKEEYGNLDSEPVSFSYIVSSLNGSLPDEMMIVVQSRRMGNRETPSYYTHVQITPLPGKMTDMAFYKMLNRKFIKDIDMMEYKEKNIDMFNFEPDIGNEGEYIFDGEGYLTEPSEDALTKTQIYAILRLLYRGLEYINNPVIVVLDREGDAYNKRAREVVFTIYKYIPHALREKVNFCTYCSLGISNIYDMHLVIVEKTTDYRNYNNVVDLNKESYNEIGKEKPEIEKSISYMFEKTRKQSLIMYDMFLYENMEPGDGVRLFNDIEMYLNIKKQKLDSKVLEQYADYFYDKFNKRGGLAGDLRKNLSNELKKYKHSSGYVDLYEQELKNILYNEEIDKLFSVDFIKYIRLGEILGRKTAPVFYQIWANEKILKPIKIKNKNNKKILLSDINRVEERIKKSKNLAGKQFYQSCLKLCDYLEREREKII